MIHETKSPILSVAIPAYNVEAYLRECLDSLILSSSYALDLEIIIINDGSKDGTQRIAEEYAKRHNNIFVINKENGGHGSAINTGLKVSHGKYFKLLDGDDKLDKNYLKSLISILKKTNADIVLNDYVEYYHKSGETILIQPYKNLKKDVTYKIADNPFHTKGPLLATTTFKKSLYTDNPFAIDENCFYVDMEYNLFTYLRSDDVINTHLPLYIYRLERDGQSMQISSLVKNYKQHENVILRLCKELSINRYDSRCLFLKSNLLDPMILSHYHILAEYIKSPSEFMKFTNKLKGYKFVYDNISEYGKIIYIHKLAFGLTIPANRIFRQIGRSLKK